MPNGQISDHNAIMVTDLGEDVKIKEISHVFTGKDSIDGAGVRLKRVMGGQFSAAITDPFLLFDHFGSSKPEEYLSGFPWHPHRGIETVTYLLEGKVFHEDSEGNKGVIFPSDLQWMTAGSGIFHQEMPKPLDENDPDELLKAVGLPTSVTGFQLWINLPAKHKMATPTYRSIKGSGVPVVETDSGAKVKVVSGELNKVTGPFQGGYGVDPTYLDVRMPVESDFTYRIKPGYTSILYVVGGKALFGDDNEVSCNPGLALVFSEEGDAVSVRTEDASARFLLLSGKPVREPIHWYGPIVMNSDEQIQQAMLDLEKGTFVRERNPIFVE